MTFSQIILPTITPAYDSNSRGLTAALIYRELIEIS